MESLLPVLVSHVVADSVFSTEHIKFGKARFQLKAYVQHGITLTALMTIALGWQMAGWPKAVLVAVCISLVHLLIDAGYHYAVSDKGTNIRKQYAKWFGVDDAGLYLVVVAAITQGVHFFCLRWITGAFYPPMYDLGNITWYLARLGTEVSVPPVDKLLLVVLAVVVGTVGVSNIIRILLKHTFRLPEQDGSLQEVIAIDHGAVGLALTGAAVALSQQAAAVEGFVAPKKPLPAGRWIGIFERLVMMLLVAAKAWDGVGFVLAAKSLARFRQLEDKEFADYYIVGTLMSSVVGVALGLLIGYLY
jgi:hypothetical protein